MDASHILEIFIGALIAIVIGIAFLPTVLNSTNSVTSNATYQHNFSPVVSIAQLLPLIFVIVILVGVVGFMKFRE